MTREVWSDLPGPRLSAFTADIRFKQPADEVSTFTGSVAPSEAVADFAARIRATITVPVTGDFTFWIASDDDSELRLSTNGSKFHAVKVASVTGYVKPQEWDKNPGQKSTAIPLVAGQKVFVEALHKNGGRINHLAIAWQAPGGQRELIPASALESFTVDPNDADSDDLPDDWESTHGLDLTANDSAADPDHDGYSNLEELEFNTNPIVRSGVPGSLLLETWYNIGGGRVDDLTWHKRFSGPADQSEFVFSADAPVNRSVDSGSRMRGYLIAPVTGDYTFHLAGDDSCQLWLSPSASQFAKQKIAFLDGWSTVREWAKSPSQESVVIPLVAGRKYYLEALGKQDSRDEHLEIGWKTPGSDTIEIIPGSALETYAFDAEDPDGDNMPSDWESSYGLDTALNDAAEDPDQDGIPNHLEYASGTDPQEKNTLSGGLLQEFWFGIPGAHVKLLTDSADFLHRPGARSLVTSAQTISQPDDAFGSRLRGYLTAPVTGNYIFWVLGDDENEFWLSSTSSKFDKQLLVRPSLHTTNFDTDLSQKSRVVSLVAGQTYYLEVLHKEYYGEDACQVAWTRPGGTREIIPGTVLSTFIPTAEDRDDDDLPDAWEATNGLNTNDNGRIDQRNGARGDLDGDGLTNAAEWKAGTRADIADSDSDGVNDRDEVAMMETAALEGDAAPFENVATISGSSYTAAFGTWIKEDGKARQDCVRGWLEYPVTLPAAGVYQMDLAFTPVADAKVSRDYEIVFSADGKTIQRETVTVAENSSGHAKTLSPWLAAGTHTLRVFIDNSHHFRRVTIDQLAVLAARGPDADANGTPDWVDLRLAKLNSFEAPTDSITSPLCVEGKARWSELTSIAGNPVQAAPDDRWFANVPLDPEEPTRMTASLENGGLAVTRQTTWIPVNLLDTSELTIRQGDSLKLTAFKSWAATAAEKVILTVAGNTSTFSAKEPQVHTFNTAGSIPVDVVHTLHGAQTSATVMVRVVAAPAIESPVCVVGYHREVEIPALPTGVALQFDHRLEIRDTINTSSGGQLHTLRLNSLDDRPAVFRVGTATGPVLGVLPFRAMRIRDASETTMSFVEELGANAYHVMMPVIVDGLYPDVVLKYEIFIAGVTFDDGTLVKPLLVPGDFTPEGEHTLHFYKSGTSGSSCHRLAVWQGTQRIAYRQ